MGTWTEETVGGHRCDVFEPAAPGERQFIVLYLHGVHLQRLTDKQAFVEQFERHGLSVVAPMTKATWWSDRVSPHFDPQISAVEHLFENILPFIKQRWGVEPPGIGLLGTSMGGQGALRLSYKHPTIFPVVAAISPAIDYQLRYDDDEILQDMYVDAEDVRQDTALLHIHPLNWPRHQFFCCDPQDYRWWESADRLRMKLWSLGVPYESDLETSAGGHGFEYYNAMAERAVSFLADRLDQERRRIV